MKYKHDTESTAFFNTQLEKYQMLYGSKVEFTKKIEDITIIQILFILHTWQNKIMKVGGT